MVFRILIIQDNKAGALSSVQKESSKSKTRWPIYTKSWRQHLSTEGKLFCPQIFVFDCFAFNQSFHSQPKCFI
jgi:hypothetical protein